MFILLLLPLGLAVVAAYPEPSIPSTIDQVVAPLIGDKGSSPGEPLSPIDFQNADALPPYQSSSLQNDPIELAGLFEGDIILSPDQTIGQEPDSQGSQNPDPSRNAIIKETQKWPAGIVPYIVSTQFNPLERSVLARAFLEYQRLTCIKFLPRTTETDYIHIMKGNGCSSHVGKTGGEQPVILGNGCVYTGIATHELMHALGFWHEQSRWDRDDHVNVVFANIAQGMDFNFRKYSWRDIQNLTAPYDTGSILHYGPYAFSKNKKAPTIIPKNPNDKMGQRDGLSKVDIWKISKLYNCDGTQPAPTTQAPTVSVTTESPNEGKCSDSHKHCIPWSKQGECTKNPTWMLVNCRKSCNACDSPCMDANQYCAAWKENGECERYPQYMHTYCAKSCGTCKNPGENEPSDIPVNQQPLLPECLDTNEKCPALAKEGECKRNPNYMVKFCRKSCNYCITSEGVNGDDAEINEISKDR